jgi:hypothetical protein
MTADAARLLDELMGAGRNRYATEKTIEVHWSDEEVSDACY